MYPPMEIHFQGWATPNRPLKMDFQGQVSGDLPLKMDSYSAKKFSDLNLKYLQILNDAIFLKYGLPPILIYQACPRSRCQIS